jgi:hypothetical protein
MACRRQSDLGQRETMIERLPLTARAALAGAVLGAVLVAIAIIGGRGNTALLRVLLPGALYFGDWTHSEFCCLIAALAEWPLYGWVLGWAIDKRSILACASALGLVIFHVALAWSLA